MKLRLLLGILIAGAVDQTAILAEANHVSCFAASNWISDSFANQTGNFVAEFDVKPSGDSIDAVIGLSSGAASQYSNLAVIVRFFTNSTIDARNGDHYSAITPVGYSSNNTYHFILDIDVAMHEYSVYVRGGAEQLQVVGLNYTFRSEQGAILQLNNISAFVNIGGPIEVCNFTIRPVPKSQGNTLFADGFDYTNGVVINEFTRSNPDDPAAHKSPFWEMTSGTLFADGSAGWTGVPDNATPDANSSTGNNSAVFRLTTKSNFSDVAVSVAVLHQGLLATPSLSSIDGVHIFLRYQSQSNLYYASFNRRDNRVVIKKKVPGGPAPVNNGTYYELSSYLPYTVVTSRWQWATATVQNNPDGSVSIKLYSANTLLVSATDNGSLGGPPIRTPGKVGIRADNANLRFENFTVRRISPSSPVESPNSVTNLSVVPLTPTSLQLAWSTFGNQSNHFYSAEVFTVSQKSSFVPLRLQRIQKVGQNLRAEVLGLQPDTAYNVFLRSSRDLSSWSLPSNIAVARTSN